MKVQVSIITISFNDQKNLERTINSVKIQTLNDFEYIVVDGGSTDGSLEVIKRNEHRISKWVSEPDNGIYDAMNKGLEMATGEFVLFMNAGDTFYAADTLKKIPFSEYPEADIFYGETVMIDSNGNMPGLRSKRLPHNLKWTDFRKGMVVCHQSILVRRNIAPKYNLEYKLSADVEWVLHCLKRSKQNVFTGTIIACFLEGGASKQRHAESLGERFEIMKKYFGLPATLYSHMVFLIQTVLVKIRIKPFYRNNYLN